MTIEMCSYLLPGLVVGRSEKDNTYLPIEFAIKPGWFASKTRGNPPIEKTSIARNTTVLNLSPFFPKILKHVNLN